MKATDAPAVSVSGTVFYWRGPAPFHFVRVPDDNVAFIKGLAAMFSYGWGMIPVTARLGSTSFTTSLFPKAGGYLVPLKDAVRSAENVDLDDQVTIIVELRRRK
ncbi:DUF1905 domain-containing protein [Pseudarthrobacter sp. J1738]|uniref:DUF1905 domain-containing protein n=1 Tax=Pseudarthrobacter sp. J1738 TaxID=3420446 RepID=UPI003D2C7EA9